MGVGERRGRGWDEDEGFPETSPSGRETFERRGGRKGKLNGQRGIGSLESTLKSGSNFGKNREV